MSRLRRHRRPRPGRGPSRRLAAAIRRRRQTGDDRLPHLVTLAAGVVLAASVFAPWYSPSLSEPFTPDPATGWSATALARVVLALALAVAVCAALLGLDRARQITLTRSALRLLGTIALSAAGAAVALVLYRFVLLPEASGLLTRDWGLFLALIAAVVALVGASTLKVVEDD